jgi:hypothetical protein
MTKFETAKNNWLNAKKNYDEIVKMYEHVSAMLEQSHNTLNEAWDEFFEQQKIMSQFFISDNVVQIKKEE